ncbi:MAG: PqqD family protein [Bacilli bacterium]|nr:PqqD family protein [Bacilli bacterium]
MKKYKIKEGFVLRQIKDNYIVVALGKASKEFNGMMNLNETGAFIWNLLNGENTVDDIVGKMTKEYDVSEEIAREDLEGFIDKLIQGGMVE